MGTRIKLWNIFSRVLFILVFAASVGVFYMTRTGEGWVDFIINLIFDGIAAAALIAYFAGCARPVARVASALSRVTEDILLSDEDTKSLWARYSQNPAPFGNRRLDERYGAFLRQTRRLQKQNSLTADCRVDDYIDEELVYSTVNKSFCDQLGGLMSGLGILFTFIGLVYGLRNFDASTVDVMQSSTQALMSGIKIAFLTSIFGLIYSLLFGLTYKKLLKDSLNALYSFQDAYMDAVRPTNEHGGENAMLRLQMEQNAALQSFGTGIGDQVSEAIITLMGPTVDKLQSTITQYVTVAIEDQRAGMDKVVRYFLQSMETSLGGVFTELKNRTEELARWQKEMISGMESLTAGVGQTGKDLISAQQQVARITDTMASYTAAMEKLTAAQGQVTAQMQSFMEGYHALHQQEEAYLQSIAASAKAAEESANQSMTAAKAAAGIAQELQAVDRQNARELTAAGQSISESAQAVRAMSETVTADVSNAAEKLSRAAGNLEEELTRSVTDSVAKLDDGISRLTGCLSGLNNASAGVMQSLKALPKTVSGVDSDVKATAKAIDTELKLLLKAASDTQKSLSKFSAELQRQTGL